MSGKERWTSLEGLRPPTPELQLVVLLLVVLKRGREVSHFAKLKSAPSWVIVAYGARQKCGFGTRTTVLRGGVPVQAEARRVLLLPVRDVSVPAELLLEEQEGRVFEGLPFFSVASAHSHHVCWI